MTSWICMKLLQDIFRDTDFENFYQIWSDKLVISWFSTSEILWISRIMWKSNNFDDVIKSPLMTSYRKKLSWQPRYGLDLSFKTVLASVGPVLWSPQIILWDHVLTFHSSKNTSKWSKIEKVNMFSDSSDPEESDEQVGFYPPRGCGQSSF